MVRGNNLYACSVCAVDDFLYDLISGEDLNVDQINVSGLCCLDVQLSVCFRLDSFLAALFGGTERHQNRNIAECCTKVF